MMYVCLVCPAIIASMYEIKEDDSNFNKIFLFAKYCLLINFLFILFEFIIGRGDTIFEEHCSILFYLIYLLFGIILSYLLPRIIDYCRKNIKICVKRENNESK